jgi:hypothetical protein
MVAATAARTSSPRLWPWVSLMRLKWSRSSRTADSGDTLRDAWATIRRSVSCTDRLLGRPVRASVAARISAMARLRRLASTGAAWVTDSRTRGPMSSACLGWLTSTEPMTWPPTSSGSQVVASGRASQTWQASSGSRSRPPWCTRPNRTARQERGLAPCRESCSGHSGSTGVAASSRSALLLRFRTVARLPSMVRSRCRLSRSWASVSVSLSCMVSANSAWAASWSRCCSRRPTIRSRVRPSSATSSTPAGASRSPSWPSATGSRNASRPAAWAPGRG